MSNIPSRFREKSCRRFEGAIGAIVSDFPGPVDIDPVYLHLSTTTYAARLRDAIEGFKRYRYPFRALDRGKFMQVADEIVVRPLDDGRVLCGSREAVKPANVEAVGTILDNGPKQSTPIVLDMDLNNLADLGTVSLLGTLAAKRALVGPIQIRMSRINAEYLEKNFDVSVCEIGETEEFVIL